MGVSAFDGGERTSGTNNLFVARRARFHTDVGLSLMKRVSIDPREVARCVRPTRVVDDENAGDARRYPTT